jgi:hypothetical protein
MTKQELFKEYKEIGYPDDATFERDVNSVIKSEILKILDWVDENYKSYAPFYDNKEIIESYLKQTK